MRRRNGYTLSCYFIDPLPTCVDPLVVSCLTRRNKVQAMWKAAPKDETNQIERLKCWKYILSDNDLCALYGANASAGKE